MCLQRLSPFPEATELIETRTHKTSLVFCVPRKHHQDPAVITRNPSSTLVDIVDKSKAVKLLTLMCSPVLPQGAGPGYHSL